MNDAKVFRGTAVARWLLLAFGFVCFALSVVMLYGILSDVRKGGFCAVAGMTMLLCLVGLGMMLGGVLKKRRLVRMWDTGVDVDGHSFAWSAIKEVAVEEGLSNPRCIRVTYADKAKEARTVKIYPREMQQAEAFIDAFVEHLPDEVHLRVPEE